MTFEALAQVVADDFKETMDTFGFDSFNEMAECYWWDSKDIKEEVDSILRTKNTGAYIDECDGSLVIKEDGDIEYRTFARMWRKLLK